ncbi:unnamed protein product [Musa banksii]
MENCEERISRHLHVQKKDGDQDEITEIHIDAALELLSEACSLESCTSDNISETKNILDIYTDAVRLFKHYAEASEKKAKMKVAALGYKCVEVTHFRILMFRSNLPSGSDRYGTQNMKRQLDVDAEKNQTTVAEVHQLLDVAEHVDAAMGASSRYRRAFDSAAKGNSSCAEELRSMKEAIEFSYYDLDGFIRLVRLALKNSTNGAEGIPSTSRYL